MNAKVIVENWRFLQSLSPSFLCDIAYIITVNWAGTFILITPPKAHMSKESLVSIGPDFAEEELCFSIEK